MQRGSLTISPGGPLPPSHRTGSRATRLGSAWMASEPWEVNFRAKTLKSRAYAARTPSKSVFKASSLSYRRKKGLPLFKHGKLQVDLGLKAQCSVASLVGCSMFRTDGCPPILAHEEYGESEGCPPSVLRPRLQFAVSQREPTSGFGFKLFQISCKTI